MTVTREQRIAAAVAGTSVPASDNGFGNIQCRSRVESHLRPASAIPDDGLQYSPGARFHIQRFSIQGGQVSQKSAVYDYACAGALVDRPAVPRGAIGLKNTIKNKGSPSSHEDCSATYSAHMANGEALNDAISAHAEASISASTVNNGFCCILLS